MPDPFDAYLYLKYLRARWRLPATVIVAAVVTSLAFSLVLPKKYTARTSVVIEPPAGSDPRASTAISPIYLESLKTYERFAASDHLFAQAVDRFQLRDGRPLERLKRGILEVEIPSSTKVLEIAVTLRDPSKAHAVALYLAEETIKLNRKTNRAGDEELILEARQAVEEAARRLAGAESARARFRRRSPTQEALKAELDELRSVREEVGRLLLTTDLSAAGQQSREESASAVNRGERLRREASQLDRRIAARQQMLADRTVDSDRLDSAYEAAWTAHDQLEKRLRELQATAGYRGERLNLLDPGVPPERPSSPNLPLNLVVAAALGLIASLFYLTVEFSVASHESEMLRQTLRVASKP